MPKVRTSIAIEPELKERLRELAGEMPGLSMSQIVVSALEMHLPHLEAASAAYRAAPEDRESAAMEALFRSMMRTLREGGDEA